MTISDNMKNSSNTLDFFDEITGICKDLFLKKMKDYGPTWAIFRWESLADQIWIKAKRVRTLEELEDKKLIPEGRDIEYIGIINYSLIALIKLWYREEIPNLEEIINKGEFAEIDERKVSDLYDKVIERVRELMIKKNHDYGEAWREMKVSSITDQILIKLYRIRNILKLDRKLQASEDLDAQFSDIINYCVFALIKMRNEA
ncbi:MAG: hypothetical protein MPEBLZ_03993 [Candidatus Methanoperedens nitroreducens]|uniref:Nucleotide modification associated domain-containing protein n=1 Tax=Candidatus Methanoperedens nitratireducens TaxID=1392998 RepID=A0A0N8KQ87_9EURY|nr:DUF1599 domain-containing protein [Candidatus Methanoperedens sp. BLZ2]KPQ41450.1 MAG: hypothetical protein MPEBLZ_03993 [Candidatus Methanoperedens sp. BLZ1]MBZ0176115.1 DUF1599 domain-containing protein [Candidatus Methanoperedens nitroreducens]MCX9079362.1 DUF1599 domain-containing protein [Candidatus Methanoperedens sp.]CAG0962293.1 hypothetical protein METP2_00869 [Methanosarcinales archaeon]MCX9087121.1 DUF1599 domain-containing protein [Candidatus Methanoperedens sp.]